MVLFPFYHVRLATSLLLSLVAFFYLILSLYNTTTCSIRLSNIHNIRRICTMLQELLQTVTRLRSTPPYNLRLYAHTNQELLQTVTIAALGYVVTYCYNFFLATLVKNFFQLLHIVTNCYKMLVGTLNNSGIGHNYHHTTSTTSRVYTRGSNIQ